MWFNIITLSGFETAISIVLAVYLSYAWQFGWMSEADSYLYMQWVKLLFGIGIAHKVVKLQNSVKKIERALT